MADNAEADGWGESQHWVTEADRYDDQLAPFAGLILERVALGAGDVVLDVGCGCGATTIEAARTTAAAIGVDISAEMLVVARQRAKSAHVDLPAIGGGGPGMFPLADRDRLGRVLTDAGFDKIDILPVNPPITLAGGGDLSETVEFLLGTGIARALFDRAAPDARRRAIDAVTDALADFYEPGRGVRLGTGAWLVSAIRSRSS